MNHRASDRLRAPFVAWIVFSLVAFPAAAQEVDESSADGQVRMPLEHYQHLQAQAAKTKPEEPPPVAVTVSQADIRVEIPQKPGQPALVRAAVTVHALGNRWTPVPLLPAGTALKTASEKGQAISLGDQNGQLVWSVKGRGTHALVLEYSVPVIEAASGKAVHLPVPAAAVMNLTATIPGQGLDVAVIPSAGYEVREEAEHTVLQASVPRASGVQLSWRVPADLTAVVVGAAYHGQLKAEVVAWKAKIAVRVLTPEPVLLDLLAADVALAQARVDGKQALVRERQGKLAIQVSGVGRHELELDFETAVEATGGPAGTSLWLPRPPLTSFRLDLPGDKEVTVVPKAGIERTRRAGRTLAVAHIPPSDRVRFAWSEALPDTAKEKLQANAEVYHVVRAEEGVLQIEALVAYQVTRGASNSLAALLPLGVAVNGVDGEGVSDWRVTRQAKHQELTIYLDRDLKGAYRYRVEYERLLGAGDHLEAPPVEIPLLAPAGTNRQRGMVALLSGSELSMQPQGASGMNKVGENQLPTWVRGAIQRTVAHTYKFIDPAAQLAVRLAPPERKQGKFDATVDTLFSVGDGVMKASATVEIAIKTGRMMELDLTLPDGINLVGVTAPSLRDHKVIDREGDSRILELKFTQELEGSLRIEVAYERVLSGVQEQVQIPAIHVPGADMEQGRLAVEALTAVEVQTSVANRVLPLDVQELPRQLTLRTTNPILLAYKYVHAEPPFQLTLEVRHHAEMKVQVASIDRADYQTLFTRHGLALTRATYHVRNRRKQFLKVQLPAGSELWSAALNGQPVKPARSEEESVVLVPLVNSAAGFQIEVVYATATDPLGFAGRIDGVLPVPDIVETRSTWNVFLPTELSYGRVDSNMTISLEGGAVDLSENRTADFQVSLAGSEGLSQNKDAAGHVSGRLAGERTAGVLPLQIEVPRRGVHYQFEKLFANRGDERSSFSIRYTTPAASTAGGFVMLLGVFCLAALLASQIGLGRKFGQPGAILLGLGGLVAVVVSLWFMAASTIWALVGVFLAVAWYGVRALLARRMAMVGETS